MPRLRRAQPAGPVALLLARPVTLEDANLALGAARLGIRAIVSSGEALGPALRRWMCAPRKLGTEIVEWLSIPGAPIPGLAAKAVHTHALELGLEDASPLRRSFRRSFDTSPSTVKQTIG